MNRTEYRLIEIRYVCTHLCYEIIMAAAQSSENQFSFSSSADPKAVDEAMSQRNLMFVVVSVVLLPSLIAAESPHINCECTVNKFKTHRLNVHCSKDKSLPPENVYDTEVRQDPPKGKSTCDEDVVDYLNPRYSYYEGFGLYAIYRVGRNWHDAKKTCEADGTHMVVPETMAEMELLTKIINSDPGAKTAWVGLTDSEKEGFWMSILGKPLEALEFKAWADGSVTNEANVDCAYFSRIDRKLHGHACHWARTVVCEKPITVQIPEGYKFYEGTGFLKAHNEQVTYLEARKICKEEGSHIAVPDSEQNTESIIRAAALTSGSDYIWVGFNDIEEEGTFMTETGKPFSKITFKYWGHGDPHNLDSEDCGAMFLQGTLADRDCNKKFSFICELDHF